VSIDHPLGPEPTDADFDTAVVRDSGLTSEIGFDHPLDDLEDLDDSDDDFAPRPRQKLGRASWLLVAAFVLGVGFLGGVLVQKHDGTAPSGSGLTAAGARAAFGGAAGARGGFGGAGGGAGGGAAGGAASGSGSGSASTVPAVIGQVVSVDAQTMVVKNLGGTQVTVHLTSTTTVTKALTAADLKAGQTVAVSGTTASDASVTATTITIQ